MREDKTFLIAGGTDFMRADKTARKETDADLEKITTAIQKCGKRVSFPESDGMEDDAEEPRYSRSKNGSGIARRIISALMLSAISLAGAANQTWTDAVRYNRPDFAEISCTADSQLAGEIVTKGGRAGRYLHWNGFELTTTKGANSSRTNLEAIQPRWI